MKIKFSVPISLTVTASKPELLDFSTDFVEDQFTVALQLDGAPALEVKHSPPPERYLRHIDRLVFTVAETGPSSGSLQEIASSTDKSTLAALIGRIANRALRSIRNFGQVPHLRELDIEGTKPELLLRSRTVETLADNGDISPLIAPYSRLRGALMKVLAENPLTPHLRINSWDLMQEAIQDSLPPGPEHEFRVNAIEHLHSGNLRLALIESVVGLEIVLAEYIREYLLRVKGLSNNRIEDVLGPKLDLHTRLNLLAPLIFTSDEADSVNLDVVKKAVSWRNKAIHATGHLPPRIPSEEIRKAIFAVVAATSILATLRNRLSISSDLRTVADQVAAAMGVPTPEIFSADNHRFMVRFEFSPFQEFPPIQRMHEIVLNVCERLRDLDPRLVPEEHLVVGFRQSTNVIAQWRGGNLEMRGTPDALHSDTERTIALHKERSATLIAAAVTDHTEAKAATT